MAKGEQVAARESEFRIVAEGDAPGGARGQVMAGGTAADYLHSWSDGRLVDVSSTIKNFGRSDQQPLRIDARADPRVRRLHLVSKDGDECDALPVADDHEVGVTLFFVATTWMTRLRSVQCFDADGRALTPLEPA